MKYRKKPVVIEATRWFKNGDHPQDNCFRPFEDTGAYPTEPREGAVVRYYRHPSISGVSICSKCGHMMHGHGWIDTLEDGHNVCPGDWIITGILGEYYPCKPDVFEKTYEEVNNTLTNINEVLQRLKYPIDLDGISVPEAIAAIKDILISGLPKERDVNLPPFGHYEHAFKEGYNWCLKDVIKTIEEA